MKIFVALSTFGECGDEPLQKLKQSGFTYFLNPSKKRLVQEEIISLAKESEGIIAGVESYDAFVLEELQSLRCISRCGVGIDNIDLVKAKEKNIHIFNTPHVVIQPVAELTLAMMFGLLRQLPSQAMILKNGKWEKKIGHLLYEKKIGIVGLGRIGKRVSELLRSFGNRVYGADIYPDDEWAKQWGVALVSIKELLSVADIVSIHISPTKEYPFRLGEEEIALMKKGSYLINVSRGSLVDEEALYKALRKEHLAGAALDVFEKEPYQGKLCEMENIILTPHIATFTKESRNQMELEAVTHLINFFKTS